MPKNKKIKATVLKQTKAVLQAVARDRDISEGEAAAEFIKRWQTDNDLEAIRNINLRIYIYCSKLSEKEIERTLMYVYSLLDASFPKEWEAEKKADIERGFKERGTPKLMFPFWRFN